MSAFRLNDPLTNSKPGVPEWFTWRFALVVLYTAGVGAFDAYCTKFLYSITTYARLEFGAEFSQVVAMFKWVYLGGCLAFIPRAMADIVGRRWMLWFTSIGLCVVMWFIANVDSFTHYFYLLILLAIFYKSDIYILVVSEEAPPALRGFYSGLVVAFGALGGVALGYMVSVMGSELNAWRNVARVPVYGLILTVPGILLIQETVHFQRSILGAKRKIRWTSIFEPFRGQFLVPLLLISVLKILVVGIAMAAVAMTYAEYLRAENGFDEKTVGRVIQLDVVASIAALILAGAVSDMIGRRWCFSLMACVYATALIGFAFCPRGGIGVLLCFVVQSFASTALYIILRIASTECFPNSFRAIGSAWTDLFMTISAAGTAIVLRSFTAASQSRFPGSRLAQVYVLICVCIVLSIVFYAGLDETKGAHLEHVGAPESA